MERMENEGDSAHPPKKRIKECPELLAVSKKAGKAIKDFGMIRAGDRIAVAVSGGKDSLSLLHVLRHRLRVSPVKFEFVAVHIDFGFADFDPAGLIAYLREQEFPCLLESVDWLKDERYDEIDCYWWSRNRRKALFQLCEREGFNKIAFGTPYKRLPSGRIAREATVVANVEGRYDESSGTNEAEARQIIDWLNLIEPTAARSTYPVVGIACSTVQQRDLIAGQLLKIRQRKQPGFEKIQQMLLSGLGVYQFAELQGQHVDMLLISLTHGTTDAQGSLTRHLHFWNTQLGLNQLHVVLTRATQKLFIAHSIPPGLHSVLAADRNFLGTCILSHLVTFAEHLQRGEGELAEEQLQKMKGLLNYTESYYPFSTFMEEVEFALRPYFEASQLKRNALAAGVRVPLFLEAKNEKEASSVLFFDGVLAKSAMPSYEWEEKMKRFFHQSKIEVVPTLSVQWWKSPKQEARKLASRLLRGEEK